MKRFQASSKRRHSFSAQGISLLEILVVVGIVGILFAVGLVNLWGAADRTKLKNAAQQLAGDVQRARSSAQRFNQDASITIPAGTSRTYTITIDGNASNKTLPRGTQLNLARAETLTYTAPYGELNAAANEVLRLELSKGARDPIFVKVIGVTGKVLVSDVAP